MDNVIGSDINSIKAENLEEVLSQIPTHVHLTCTNCGKKFFKTIAEYKKQVCSRKCKGVEDSGWYCTKACAAQDRVSKQVDEKTPWRYCHAVAKGRAKRAGLTFSITIDDIIQLWDEQKGICPYTGWKMQYPVSAADSKDTIASSKKLSTPWHASIDRISSEIGYELGNVELVCLAVNYAKNKWTKEQMVEFWSPLQKNITNPDTWQGII